MSLDPLVEEPDAGSEVFPYSTNISDHVTPTACLSSSNDIIPILAQSFDFTSDVGWLKFGTQVNFIIDLVDERMECLLRNGNVLDDGLVFPVVDIANFNFILKFKLINDSIGVSVGLKNSKVGLTDVPNIGQAFRDAILFYMNYVTQEYGIGEVNGQNWVITNDFTAFAHALALETIWVKIERTSTTSVTCSLYSDSTFTTLIESITKVIPADVESLDNIVVASGVRSNASGVARFFVDDMTFERTPVCADSIDDNLLTFWKSLQELQASLRLEYSGIADKEPSQIALYIDKAEITALQFLIQTSPDGITWTLKRTVNVEQLTDLEYNFIRFNRDILPIRYIRIISNDATIKFFSVTETKALIPDEIQWADRQAHKTISATGIVGLSG